MIVRRVAGLAALVAATMLWISCGQVYRPVVIPIEITPPNSGNFHAVFGISSNAQANPGTALQIDVSGDTDIGVENMGITPTHAAALPNNARIFVASAGSLFLGESDVVTSFTPAVDSTIATGLGTPTVFTLPNVGANQVSAISSISESGNVVTAVVSSALLQAKANGTIVIANVIPAAYNGSFIMTSVSGNTIQYTDSIPGLAAGSGGTATIPLPLFCQYLPDFVATTQTTAVYVSNFGAENVATCNLSSTDSVALLSTTTNTITNIAYLAAGSHPVAMTETPNGLDLYVINQLDAVNPGSVLNLSPTDLSTQAVIPVGINPTWIVSRSDSQRVYVLDQGDGQLFTINTVTNAVMPSYNVPSVGVGANFVLYDPNLSRLYVTNPSTGNVFVLSTTGGTADGVTLNDTPSLLCTISMTGSTTTQPCPNTGSPTPPCASACSPVSVAALPDGSKFYVASYESQSSCSDPDVGSTACIIPMLTVFDATSLTVKPVSSTLLAPSPSLSLLMAPQFVSTQYGVPTVSACAPPAAYSPGSTRFRMFTAPSADSSHVYVSICDAGSIADIDTTTSSIATGTSNTPDTLITDLAAPAGLCTGACGTYAVIGSFSINSGVATFQAANSFTAGLNVTISGLTSSPGLLLDGITCTVLSTGLSATQFECIPSPTQANVSSTMDSGTAVPQAPPQSPIFLLTGQ
jgi:hypothetical protein